MTNLDLLVAQPGALMGNRTHQQILSAALLRLRDQRNWSQGMFARDERGRGVKPLDSSACCWCLLGAVAAESNEFGIIPPQLLRFLEQMMYYLYGDKFATLGDMNDFLSHESVIGFLQASLSRFQP